MTTAEERKARREERLMKEEKRRYIFLSIWTVLKYAGAIAAMVAAAMWLAVVMWDNAEWSLTISWMVASATIGAVLFKSAAK